ncbi:MAG: hypothetical protein WBG92_19410 [Thiohalocapsa sp.]
MSDEGQATGTAEQKPFLPGEAARQLAELQHQRAVCESKQYEAQAHVLHWEFQRATLQAQITALQAEITRNRLPAEIARMTAEIQSGLAPQPAE